MGEVTGGSPMLRPINYRTQDYCESLSILELYLFYGSNLGLFLSNLPLTWPFQGEIDLDWLKDKGYLAIPL